jgi:predicted DNA-binding transcriptional regulator YafY
VNRTFEQVKASFREVQRTSHEVSTACKEVSMMFHEMQTIVDALNMTPHDATASSRELPAMIQGPLTPFDERSSTRTSREASSRLLPTVGLRLPSVGMRRRTQAEILAAIVEAFHESRTWTQAALAERLGVESRRVKNYLEVLIETGQFPLERSTEGIHVYWSLPKGWVAGGATVSQEEIAQLARILARAPRSAPCTQLLAKFLACSPLHAPRPVEPDTVNAPARGDWEERMLAHAESSAARRVPLRVRYRTASRDEVTDRSLSVQRIQAGPPARLIAWCHSSDQLKTFRVDRIQSAVLDSSVPFVRCDPAEVDARIARSVDGFLGPPGPPIRCRFRVREPEAHWVAGNLLAPMVGERRDGGAGTQCLEVTVETTAIEQIARFVVGLGGAATPLTPELEAAVRTLAEGALATLAKGGAGTS